MKTRNNDSANSSNTTALAMAQRSPLRGVNRFLRRLWRNQRGANFLEYGVLCGCVAVAGITVVTEYGGEIVTKFGTFRDAVKNLGVKK